MSSHAVTVAGYVVIALIGAMIEFLARRPGSAIPRFDTVLRTVLRTRSGRIGVFAWWAWLGLHFLG